MRLPNIPNHRRLVWAALLLCLSAAVWADDDHDHDRARKALQAGEVLPLRTILDRVERVYPGQVLDVELERGHAGRDGRWIYKVKVLQADGSLLRLKVDAREGTVLGSKPPTGGR